MDAETWEFVGADDYSTALETARYLLKAMNGKGNFIILEGVKGALTNTDRVRGFNDALKENRLSITSQFHSTTIG